MRKRSRLASKGCLKNLRHGAFFFQLAVQPSAVGVQDDRKETERQQPRGAQIGRAIELHLRAALELVAGAGELAADRRGRQRLVVGEEFVSFVQLFQAEPRMREQRRRNGIPPLELKARVVGEQLIGAE